MTVEINGKKKQCNIKAIWNGIMNNEIFDGKVVEYDIDDYINKTQQEISDVFNTFKKDKKDIITQCFDYSAYYLFDNNLFQLLHIL